MKTILSLLLLLSATSLRAQVLDVIGDSYVANHRCPQEETWHYKLASQLGLTYRNYGRNGSCVAFDRTHDGKYNFGPAMWQRYTAMDSTASFVIIIAGHNDAVKCGSNKDSLQMFRDSLETLLTGIEQHCPNARIGYVTPWYVPRPGFKQVCRIIRDCCKRHGIPVLWNYSKRCPVKVRDEEFRRQYFQGVDDTAHLNAAGHDLFLPTALTWFERELQR